MNKGNLSLYLRGVLFILAAVFIGHLIAKKIFNIPTRLDLLIFITLIAFIPVMKFPISGVYFLFIVPPFIGMIRRVFYLFSERPGNDLLIVIPDVVVVLLFVVLFDRLRKKEHVKTEDSTLVTWVWIFLLYQLLRAYVGNGSGATVGLFQFKFVGLYILCFFYAIFFIKTKKQVLFIFKLTTILGVFIALWGIKQAFFGFAHFEELWLEKMRATFVTLFIGGKPRPFSTLPSPASFADAMVIAMVTGASLISMDRVRGKPFYLVAMPVMFFALLITSVRSNWIGFLVGAIFWYVLAHRSSVRLKVGLMAVLLIFYFSVTTLLETAHGGAASPRGRPLSLPVQGGSQTVTDLFVKSRTSALTDPFQEHSMISRSAMWRQVIHCSFFLPMGPLGWGMGSFNAHSYYFSTLYDIGYPGLFLLLFILYRIFRAGYLVYREEEEKDRRIMARGLLTLLFSISVMNTTGPHIAEHPADIYYWFSAGLLLVLRRLKSGNDDENEKLGEAIVDPT
jgi:hypothetical protein